MPQIFSPAILYVKGKIRCFEYLLYLLIFTRYLRFFCISLKKKL